MRTGNFGRLIGLSALLWAFAVPAFAQTITFEGLQNFETVNNYYNGGTGGNGSGPGPNIGVAFSPNALALIDSDSGGSGNFGGEPSPDTIMFFTSGTAVMNVAAGFTTGFSFFYSAPGFAGVIRVYDGVNATGNLLATLTLPLTPSNGAPDPSGTFSPFVPIGVSFPGTARSVDFGGTVNQIGFDNITLGAVTPGGSTTCASEGYTGTQLEWCKNICERGYTGNTLNMWIRRWTDRYRTLPYCARK